MMATSSPADFAGRDGRGLAAAGGSAHTAPLAAPAKTRRRRALRDKAALGSEQSLRSLVDDLLSARRSEERRVRTQFATTRLLAESASLAEAAPRILETLCLGMGWTVGALWTADPTAGGLRLAEIWHPASAEGARLAIQLRGVRLSTGEGLPGRVWASGRPEWLAHSQPDPASGEATAADDGCGDCGFQELDCGFQELALPVPVGGRVAAVLVFSSRRAEPAGEEMRDLMADLACQVGLFVARRRSEDALRDHQERTRSLIENMRNGLVTLDGNGVIHSANPAAERLFGLAGHELVGQPLAILFNGEAAADRTLLRRPLGELVGRVLQCEGRRQGGELFSFELFLFSEYSTSSGRRFAATLTDASQWRAADRLKNEFVSTVSHELRTPLTSIRGSIGLLAGGACGDLPPQARQLLQVADRNCIRLVALINDILDLEKVDTGRMKMRREPVALLPLVARSLEAVRGTATAKGISLTVEGRGGNLSGDGERLTQVIVNLLSNAIKYSPPGSVVTVFAEETREGAEVRIADHGPGIPREQWELIFERFQQLESSDTREKGGSGLGLAICKAFVEQHGGTIGLESEIGQGSTFWFRIPAGGPQPLRECRSPRRSGDNSHGEG